MVARTPSAYGYELLNDGGAHMDRPAAGSGRTIKDATHKLRNGLPPGK
jgi:hypothetical protein